MLVHIIANYGFGNLEFAEILLLPDYLQVCPQGSWIYF